MSTVIKVENLSKKYTISHKGQGRYVALRDVVTDKAKELFLKKEKRSPTHEEFWALKDVDFEVKKGDRIGIIGKNGAGKTTLLKILGRVTEPTRGRISIRGRVASLLEVGTGFHPELTGRENIFLNGAILGMTRADIKKKFDEIVAFAEVERFLDTPVKRYSSGMYVRLAFAVAAHLESQILLIDEVLAVGDASFQKKCLGKMETISDKEGRTIMFVSHNMSVINASCNKAMLFDAGSLVFFGKVFEAINRYTSKIAGDPIIDLLPLCHKGPQDYGYLTRLSVHDKDLNPCNKFAMGQSMIARISLHCKRRLPNAEIGLKVSSITGIAIHYFVSIWEGLRQDLESGDHIFEVEVPKVLLLPGKYVLNVWLLREGNPSDDYVQDAMIVEIFSSDVTGHLARFDQYSYSGCEIYAPSKWRKLSWTGRSVDNA